MRALLTVAVAQPVCVPGDVAANALVHAATVRASGARVVVFPELSITGYVLTAPSIAADDRRLAPIVEACAETGALALVGAPVRDDDGRDYLATLAVDGAGVTLAYRKIYLHPPEPDRFAAGDQPAVIDVDGWRLGLAICRDTGVAQHAVDTAALGIDAYLAGSLFVPGEENRYQDRMRDLAVRHGIWVANANFAGLAGDYAETIGRSGVWAPDGSVAAEAGAEPGEIVQAELPQPASQLR